MRACHKNYLRERYVNHMFYEGRVDVFCRLAWRAT
jgi:hypothetical protein